LPIYVSLIQDALGIIWRGVFWFDV